MKFNKPATYPTDLVSKLENRGLIIPDRERAVRYLMHIGYYRLSAYMLPYQLSGLDHQFVSDTKFDDILNLYIFDRKLRLHLLEAIERIEISLRAQISDNFVLAYGAHGYLNKVHFKENYNYNWFINQLTKQHENSTEVFITHYKSKYTKPTLSPFWMAIQLLTFKEISILLQNFSNNSIGNTIAGKLEITDTVIFSWCRSLSDLRNICAHHGRVWNRVFGARPKIPKKPPKKWIYSSLDSFETQLINGGIAKIDPSGSLYFQIVILWHWLTKISPSSSWLIRLLQLFKDYNIDLTLMGFQSKAFEEDFWNITANT